MKTLNNTEINQLNPSPDVLHALNVTKRGCEELLPENDWLRGQAQTGSFLVGEMKDEDGDGIWERVEPLGSGRYQYKFVIDKVNWKEDPNNPNRIDDGFGGFNSLIDVR